MVVILIDGVISMASPQDELKVYDQVCTSYRAVDDFRGKLLGFLPLVSGAGIFTLADKIECLSGKPNPIYAAIGAFGLLITVALFCYEIYGIKKCAALIDAGKHTERLLQIKNGHFMTRPQNVIGIINEPFAAGIIYPTVMAAWVFVLISFGSGKCDRSVWIFAIAILVIGFIIVVSYDFTLRRAYAKWRP